MTKKDFELIAEVIKTHVNDKAKCFDDDNDCFAIADSFADALATTSPKFDRYKFWLACNVNEPLPEEL
jgi:hypothetical protein